MAKAVSWVENGSLFKAIDGSHLKWNDFREDVLQPFGIKVASTDDPNVVPPVILAHIQDRIADPGRFDHQRKKWRAQVTAGQGFASPLIFPPNVLPRISTPTKIQRLLSPKMSREALPRRSKAVNSLFELPSSRPIHIVAFTTEAFSEDEHAALPSSLSPVGTVVDFTSGIVDPGRTLHCPFLVFERCQSVQRDDMEKSLNMCAISGAQCVRGLQDISLRAQKKPVDNLYSFSCVLNDQTAIINIHTVDQQGVYVTSPLFRFDFSSDEHFNLFLGWIEAIEDWASGVLLPHLKDSLIKLSHSGETPPASPMPSLSLSIDTEMGSVPGLLQALRKTFPAVPWYNDGVLESPIDSSIAHCGTPAEGRRSQSLLLVSPNSAINNYNNLMVRRGRSQTLVSPISIRSPMLPYTPARPSPFSPRYSVATPANELIVESPCRPGALSPCTPPPDQPWAAKSPMLVLRKRVDIAMNEVQELRHQVENLSSELNTKNQQLNDRVVEILRILQRRNDEEKARAVELDSEPKAQEVRQQRQENDIDEDIESIKPSRMSIVFRHNGWDIPFEQILFLVGTVILGLMMIVVARDLLPLAAHGLSLFVSKGSWLHVYIRSLLDWRKMCEFRHFIPCTGVGRYFGIWRSIE